MFTGVSGIRAHQARIDVIGNNIANVNTTAFKSGRASFSSVLSQTMQAATPAVPELDRGTRNPMQIGLGVNVASINRLMTQGAAQRTDSPLHMMIEGDGFFIVGDDVNGLFFTRAGDFVQDSDWNITNPQGLILQGWQAPWQEGGPVRNEGVPEPIIPGAVSGIQIIPDMHSVDARATGNILWSGNLWTQDGHSVITREMNFRDSLGRSYSIDVQFRLTEDGWEIWRGRQVTRLSDGEIRTFIGEEEWTDTGVVLEFGADGFPIADTDSGLVPAWYFYMLTEEGSESTFGQIHETSPIPGQRSIRIDFGSLSTQFSASLTLNSTDLDGLEAGDLIGITIGQDGIVTGSYSNGENFALWQIPLASFNNQAGLESVSGNLFIQTANSGIFDGMGITPYEAGTELLAGMLEMSNVDLGEQFSQLITSQRGFQANARIITASDEMVQTASGLLR